MRARMMMVKLHGGNTRQVEWTGVTAHDFGRKPAFESVVALMVLLLRNPFMLPRPWGGDC